MNADRRSSGGPAAWILLGARGHRGYRIPFGGVPGTLLCDRAAAAEHLRRWLLATPAAGPRDAATGDSVEETGLMSKDPPPQFGLRTMLLGMTAFAVVCGLVAWCGLTGYNGVIVLGVILAAAVGTFIGLLICSYAGLGFGFEDLRWEVLRCLAVCTITVLSGYGLALLSPGLVLIAPLVMGVCMKLAWPDIAGGEMVIAGFSAVSAAGIVLAHVAYWAGG